VVPTEIAIVSDGAKSTDTAAETDEDSEKLLLREKFRPTLVLKLATWSSGLRAVRGASEDFGDGAAGSWLTRLSSSKASSRAPLE
jgi:hypothetical protein